MAGETHSGSSEDDEEVRKRKKRLEELLSTPGKKVPAEKPPAFDLALGKVAAEADKDSKKPPKPERTAEPEQAEAGGETELTPDEQAAASQRIIDARQEAVAGELATADPLEVTEIAADAQYLSTVNERIQSGEQPQDAIEAAYAAAAGLSDEAIFDGEFGDDGSEGEVDLRDHNPAAAPGDSVPGAESSPADSRADRPAAAPTDAAAPVGAAFVPEAASAVLHATAEASMVAGGAIALIVGSLVAERLKRKLVPERRVRAMQRSFERQVSQLHEQLTMHEVQIRRLAHERNEAVQAAREAQPVPTAVKTEQKPAQPETVHANTPPPDVERLALSDVLDISERIRVGDQTIRTIYEDNRISQRGLRRIVAEYLHGGNVRRVLKQELLIKAIGPELDPLLRDQVPESMTAAPRPSVAPVGEMRDAPAAQPNSAPYAAKPPTPPDLAARQQVASPGLIIANIIALVILGVLLAILFVVWLIR